jgi:glycosyltransferase involved in cell wall biosynthesis
MPKVSVILTSLHPVGLLPEAIDSLLHQTFADFELIVRADGPEDSAWSAVGGQPDRRIKVWHDDGNWRARPGVIEGVAEVVAGEYVAALHSGEVWRSDRLVRQVAYLDTHPDQGAVFAWEQGTDRYGAESAIARHEPRASSRWGLLRQLFLEPESLGRASLLIRRHCYQDVGAYRPGLAQTGDAEMLSRLLLKYPAQGMQESLTVRRESADQGGGSGDGVDSAIRASNESNVVRENYLSIASFEDLAAIFPSLERFRRPGDFDIKFLLAMACLYECEQRSAWQLGLRWLFELTEDGARSARVRALYSFSYLDLIKLTGDFDVYGVEPGRLMAEWAREGGRLFDKLTADRDWLVAQRQWLLGQREWLVAQQDRLAAERERLIAERNAGLQEIYNSTSWRLTRPIRRLARVLRATQPALARLRRRSMSSSPPVGRSEPVGSAPSAELVAGPSEGLQDGPWGTPSGAAAVVPSGTGPQFDVQDRILLVTHELSRTGAPYAALYLARALVSLGDGPPVVLSPVEGPLRQEFEREGFSTVVDPSCFRDGAVPSAFCESISGFRRVIVNSLSAFQFIDRCKGKVRHLTWWIHETGAGFSTIATMTADVPSLFSACESVWLASPLCFPLAGQYAAQEKLRLLLYGCADRPVPHRARHSGKAVFLIVGSVERRKGQDVFLGAIERLAEDLRRKAVFRIVGSPLAGNDDSVIFSLRVRTRAALLPDVRWFDNMPPERLWDFYAETDVMVSASRDDPMPIVMTEGLMLSKVCLCSSAIGQAQLLEDGRDGLIFANESVEELAQKMAWIIQNRAELDALGRGGRAVYERHFLVSAFVQNVGRLLEERP